MSTKSVKEHYKSSLLQGANASFVEALYETYRESPANVPKAWRAYFEGLGKDAGEIAHGAVYESLGQRLSHGRSLDGGDAVRTRSRNAEGAVGAQASQKQSAVSRLIQAYSLRGHQIADLDPLGLLQRHEPSVLKLGYLGLGEGDLDREFYAGGLAGLGNSKMKLRDILQLLKRIYCGKLAAELAHISRARERLWLRERFENIRANWRIPQTEQLSILRGLTRAEGIERYLNTRFVGQKRFSLEGGETLIPMLDDLIQRAGEQSVQECVIGMAHRGRLNVLVNVLGKSPQDLFSEFEGAYDAEKLRGSGDVKYHLGFSSDVRTRDGNVHVALAFNPSHLEIVDPVVEGSVRARQDRRGGTQGERVLPVLIHGDAAVAAQGVVLETLQMSQTRAFSTGGTIHIIINNQIGFTTSEPTDMRSTPYCSDVAKTIEAPVFHVNGDDPEAAVAAIRLALNYRQRFHKDVFIDLVCYRRLGHNEADEPAATQPIMYQTIRQHPSVLTLYGNKLIEAQVASADEVKAIADDYRSCLDEGRGPNDDALGMVGNQYTVDWSRYQQASLNDSVETGVPLDALRQLGKQLNTLPEGFSLHPRVQRIVDDRLKMTAGDAPLDWGFAENLAYGSLLQDRYRIRLIGQDSRRGTFFHRHAALYDQNTGDVFMPLTRFAHDDQSLVLADSLLSEEAVLGFEYGYSSTSPDCLNIWEAQFGDFANGAQVVIDQFISSGEAKWNRLCGLVLFLPHGYEGQGPEHSSARLERFLQLCAEHNMQVCVPSTPAQMFHLLRRQMLRNLRKPLIIMTPKSLLRHHQSVSSLDELASGHFLPLIGETEALAKDKVTRIVFCSGKVYYDLAEARRKDEIANVAIARIEELYPFPVEEYAKTLAMYPNATEIVWCQEEPQNQGAWYQIRHRLQEPLTSDHQLFYAGRAGAAAPAAGIHALHVHQQKALVATALSAETRERQSTLARRA